MQTYIISVDHIDETGKYWADSQVKRLPVTLQENETLHQAIARALEAEDCCTMSYKGKPQGNIYRDKKDGTSYICGYHYRTKHYIENRSDNIQKENVPFTTWVTVHGEMITPTLEDVQE
jgi:hypothetical protein